MPTVVHGDFEWDDDKASRNAAKHGVSFPEAAVAMQDPLSVDFDDLLEPANLVTLAASPTGRILYSVAALGEDNVRLISARDATRRERQLYERE